MSKGMMWTLGVIATTVTIFGGVWGMDARFTPREIHKIGIAQGKQNLQIAMERVQQQFITIQDGNKLQQARDAVFYWMKMENALRVECAKDCNNQSLRIQLDNAIKEKRKAEEYLRKLERR